jgi:hypothetical protein
MELSCTSDLDAAMGASTCEVAGARPSDVVALVGLSAAAAADARAFADPPIAPEPPPPTSGLNAALHAQAVGIHNI